MKKVLVIIGITVLLVIAIVTVAVYDENLSASGKGQDVQCIQTSQPATATSTFSCTIDAREETKQGENSPKWRHILHSLVAWPEGVTAWLLLLTLVGICWQAWETRVAAIAAADGVKLGRQEFVATFRPQIHIRKLRLIWDTDRDSVVRVALYFVNVGQGKTHVSGGEITLYRIFGYKPHERDWVTHTTVNQFDMASGETKDAEVSHAHLSTFCEMIQQETDRNSFQQSWLECKGKIEYADDNGTQRTTGFCRRYDVAKRRFIVHPDDAEDDYED